MVNSVYKMTFLLNFCMFLERKGIVMLKIVVGMEKKRSLYRESSRGTFYSYFNFLYKRDMIVKSLHIFRVKRYCYIGDFTEKNLKNPELAKQWWFISNNIITEQEKKIKLLQLKKLRLQSRAKSNEAYLKLLKSNCKSLQDGEALLRVSIFRIQYRLK